MQKINGVECKVVKGEWDVYFDMAMTMLEEILQHNAKNEKTVLIVPVGPTQQYSILAELVNRLRVPLHSVHFFNMDEYLETPERRIPYDNPMSFHGRMKRDFYDCISPELIMPENQRHFPEPGEEQAYDRMLAELGGADACFGGLGINGHIAFNEAAESDDPITAEAFANLPTRVLRISRETRTINAYGYQRGDLRGMPEWCVTVGMQSILASKRIYIALNRPWQHGPFRHALYDEEQPQLPATLLRRNPRLTYCVPEAIMEGITGK